MMSNTIIYSIKYNISRKEKRSNERKKKHRIGNIYGKFQIKRAYRTDK